MHVMGAISKGAVFILRPNLNFCSEGDIERKLNTSNTSEEQKSLIDLRFGLKIKKKYDEWIWKMVSRRFEKIWRNIKKKKSEILFSTILPQNSLKLGQ